MMNQGPILRQILLCEKLIFEQGTGNVSPINCCSELVLKGNATKTVSFVVYGVLADGYGTYYLDLAVRNLKVDEVIYRHREPGLLTDRLKQSHLVIRVVELLLPAAGRYDLTLTIDGEFAGMSSFTAREKP